LAEFLDKTSVGLSLQIFLRSFGDIKKVVMVNGYSYFLYNWPAWVWQLEACPDLWLAPGYYTHISDLLKHERLAFPVAPPEPVNDKKRMVAVLPYTKMPDTDEITFQTGDIFFVHNDLGDGWLWVTAHRTGEQGLVFKAGAYILVRKPYPPAHPTPIVQWYFIPWFIFCPNLPLFYCLYFKRLTSFFLFLLFKSSLLSSVPLFSFFPSWK
jgi:hypothetical protein